MGSILRLIGAAGDLADLPQRLKEEGIEVRLPDIVEDSDRVAFCISCTHGPTRGTREAIDRCAGRSIVPIAIVLTRCELVNDDSLRELVTVEEMELLCRVLPCQTVESLPIYYDFDPGLARRLLGRMGEEMGLITCSLRS